MPKHTRRVMLPAEVCFDLEFDTENPSDEQFKAAGIAAVATSLKFFADSNYCAAECDFLKNCTVCLDIGEIDAGGMADLAGEPDEHGFRSWEPPFTQKFSESTIPATGLLSRSSVVEGEADQRPRRRIFVEDEKMRNTEGYGGFHQFWRENFPGRVFLLDWSKAAETEWFLTQGMYERTIKIGQDTYIVTRTPNGWYLDIVERSQLPVAV